MTSNPQIGSSRGLSRRRSLFLASIALAAGLAVLRSEARAAPVAPAGDVVAELGCSACHAGVGDAARIRDRAPDLGFAGARYNAAYLLRFLLEPARVRGGIGASRMPDFRLREDEALALALFLATQTAEPSGTRAAEGPSNPEPPVDAASARADFVALGRDLGCLTCHAFEGGGGVVGPELADAGARLDPRWIRRFVVAPAAYGVGEGTMPALEALLPPPSPPSGKTRSAGETARRDALAARLAADLALLGAARRAGLEQELAAARARHPEVDAEVGRRVFTALNCAACHRHPAIAPRANDAPDLSIEGLRVKPDWLRAYLGRPVPIRPFGGRPGSGSRMPDFRLTADEVERVAAVLEQRKARAEAVREGFSPPPLSPYAARKTRALLDRKLACLGCHRLGDGGGRVGPDLTRVADRLTPAFIDAIVRDPQRVLPHAIMPKLPLPERTRTDLVRFLAMQSGGTDSPPAGEELSVTANRTLEVPPSGDAATYVEYCAPCHGAKGEGDGFNAPFLPVKPTVHADASRLSLRPDDTLFDGVFAGGAILGRSPRMPAWGGTLSRAEIEAAVREIRALCRCAGPAWSRDDAARRSGRGAAIGSRAATAPRATSAPRAEIGPRTAASPAPSPTAAAPVEIPASASAGRSPTTGFVRDPTPPRLEDFLGSEACAECHPEPFAAWSASTHAKAGGPPNRVKLLAPFDGTPIELADATVVPQVTPDGRHVFEVRGRGGWRTKFTVDAVVGGGHMRGGGTQSFFSRFQDGTIRFLPFDFMRDEKVWFAQVKSGGLAPLGPAVSLTDVVNWPPSRALGFAEGQPDGCENCHGSQIETRRDPATGRYDTHVTSFSINCESCHGPGRRHVEWAREPGHESTDDARLEPLETLDRDASLAVCLRCHADKDRISPRDLPGEELEAGFSLKAGMLKRNVYLADGRYRDFGYQQNHLWSSCYVDGSMVCTDCHDPHRQSYRDVAGRPLEGRFDDAQCTGCHASKAAAPERHTHHAPGSDASRCTSCHMPDLQHPSTGKVLHFQRSDHTIPIPRPAFDAQIGVEGACVKCHRDKRVDWLEARWHAWWGAGKPHPPAVEGVVAAAKATTPAEAAPLLLTADDAHRMAQYNGLADFVRRFVQPAGAPLPPEAALRLEALAASDDQDVRALALAALDVEAERAPERRAVADRARAALDPRETRLRPRWADSLDTLAALYASRGDAAGARRVHQKAMSLRATPAPGG